MERLTEVLLCFVFFIVLLFSVSRVVPYAAETVLSERETAAVQGQLRELAKSAKAPSDAVTEMAEQNPDMAGWLTVTGSAIDYPVMWTPEDPDYYLHRDFYKRSRRAGTPFLDGRCDPNDHNKNLLIYGHHMKTGTMFAPLMDYKDPSFWREHHVIRWITREHTTDYEIFAVLQTDTENGDFVYRFIDHTNEIRYIETIQKIKAMALYETDITPTFNQKIIILSTCEYSTQNGRLVVVGKEIEASIGR